MHHRERERCEVFAEYLVENNATVRSAAHHFSVSKSTVHKDITTILPRRNPALYQLAKKVLEVNKSERHLRGGEATRKKYLGRKKVI
jgi:putative DeoR family transcriptional regulator (stage III sporulation protein D)